MNNYFSILETVEEMRDVITEEGTTQESFVIEFKVVAQVETESEMLSQIAALRNAGGTYRAEYFNGVFSRLLEA